MKPRHLSKLAGLVLIAALLSARCAPAALPTPKENPFDVAQRHILAGEYTAAQTILRTAATARPDDPQPYLELAALYRTWNRPSDGLRALGAARQRGATTNQTIHLRLELLAAAQHWTQVSIEATDQLHVAPHDPIALRVLTQAQLYRQQCAGAAETAQQWHDVAPHDLEAAKIRGALADNTALLCQAGEELCAVAQNCCDAAYHTRLGLALIRSNDWPLAACVLAGAANTSETTAETHTWLGEALMRTGHPDAARDHLLTATTLAPESPLPWTLLGSYYVQQQDIAAAREVLLRAHHLDPANPAPCLMIAGLKAQTGQYDQATIWLEAATNAAPHDAAVWKAVARFYLDRAIVADAHVLPAIQQAIELAPEDGEARMLLGWYHVLNGDMASALVALDDAIARAPRLGQAYDLRGQALQATGDVQAAREAFTRAADLGYRP